MTRASKTFEQAKAQFLSQQLIVEGDCRCWPTRNKFGYSSFALNGKRMYRHRFAWLIHRGPIPDGMWVLHKCDNNRCVNPDHLFLGTHQDNVDDCVAKGRQRGGSLPGSKHPTSAFVDSQVEFIRTLYPEFSQLAIARYFGVSGHTIWAIINQNTYTHA